MAKNINGITGAFSGKIGTVVGAMWNGIPTIRRRPEYRRDKPTQRQTIQRARFKMASTLCRQFANVFEQSFEREPGKTKRCSAVGIVVKQAIIGVYPSLAIDYSKVTVAKGMLKKAVDPVADSPAQRVLKVSWSYDPVEDYSNMCDRAILVVYNEKTEDVICWLDGESRYKGEYQQELPFQSGDKVHAWLSFRSSDGLLRAESVYTGVVVIS